MSQPTRVLLVALLGGALIGFIGGPAIVLVVWAIAAISLGIVSTRLNLAAGAGAIFGFVVSLVFLLRGYNGVAPVTSKLIGLAALALFGAACGSIWSMAGFGLARLCSRRAKS